MPVLSRKETGRKKRKFLKMNIVAAHVFYELIADPSFIILTILFFIILFGFWMWNIFNVMK